MKTNVDLEFISKVYELQKNMRNLANFWHNNSKALEDLNVSKNYPFNIDFEDLTFDTYNWLLTLISNYCEKDPNNIFDLFDAYYKSLQK